MTTHTIALTEKGTSGLPTLTANTTDTVNFASDLPLVECYAPSTNTVEIWYTLDGSTPTVGGKNCFVLPPGAVDSREPEVNDATSGKTVVKLITSGTGQTFRVQRG